MTNQVAVAGTAGVVDTVVNNLACEVDKGKEAVNQLIAWLMEQGASFALNLLFAIVMLLVLRIASTLFSLTMAVMGIRKVYKRHGSGTPLLA